MRSVSTPLLSLPAAIRIWLGEIVSGLVAVMTASMRGSNIAFFLYVNAARGQRVGTSCGYKTDEGAVDGVAASKIVGPPFPPGILPGPAIKPVSAPPLIIGNALTFQRVG